MRAVNSTVLLLAAFLFLVNNVRSQFFIFELPELIVKMNTTYLSKNESTLLKCQIYDNVANLSYNQVYWYFEDKPITEIITKKNGPKVELLGNDLLITRGSHHAEGEYQCATTIEDIPLTENTTINTRLMSAPVKLRKARITRFATFRAPPIRVNQGQVARLPCLGMPDVVPGPPDIWMEKEGQENIPLGRTSNTRFLATPTGLQIGASHPTDSGKYYCVVRNTFTNQTRKALSPVTLIVDPKTDRTKEKNHKPMIVYPVMTNYSEAIVVDAVVGQRVVLECVIWYSDTVWSNADYTLAPITLTDETQRLRQAWGNLRFKQVQLSDSGIYECHGLTQRVNPRMPIQEPTHPRVRYLLKVYAPTSANLMVIPLHFSNHLQLSCYVQTSGYEIPTVYINGDPLVDAMEKMGISPQTSFFTNPINATIASVKPLTGSVQCISKAAMNEAEVYGEGLESGRSMNLYVADRNSNLRKLIEQKPTNVTKNLESNATLACIPASSNIQTHWLFNNQKIDVAKNLRLSIVGSASLLVVNITAADQGWYTCVARDPKNKIQSRVSAYLEVIKIKAQPYSPREEPHRPVFHKPRSFVADGKVRLSWDHPITLSSNVRVLGYDVQFRKSPEAPWSRADVIVHPHMQAVSVDIDSRSRYQYRIVARLSNYTSIFTPPTELLGIESVPGNLPQPLITEIKAVSPTALQVTWEYSTGAVISKNDNFTVFYRVVNTTDDDKFTVIGSNTATIHGLEPNTEYGLTIFATSANNARSSGSVMHFARTMEEREWHHSVEIENESSGKTPWVSFKENYLFPPNQSVIRFVAVIFLSAVVAVFLICTACVFLWWICIKNKKQLPEGKDYGQQKRTRFVKPQTTLGGQETSEAAPLTMPSKEEAESYSFFGNTGPTMNFDLYANTEATIELQSTPTRKPKAPTSEINARFDDVHPSRISLDTVVGMRAEPSGSYGYRTLKTAPGKHYVNVGSETNLYSTIRRSRRQPPFSPALHPKPSQGSPGYENTNLGYSPESSTVSPTSHSSLIGHSNEASREYRNLPPAPMSTFLPAQSAATITSLNGSYRRMNESHIESPVPAKTPTPEAV